MRTFVLGTIVALVAALLLGCGGSSDSGDSTGGDSGGAATTTSATATIESTAGTSANAGAQPAVDPCSLLTVADLEAATGLTWGEAKFNESLSSDQQWICDWVATSQFATAQVLVLASDEGFAANRDSAASVLGLAAEDPSIPGADETYATAEGSVIAMRVGGRFVQVAYVPPGPGNVIDATLKLAQAVAARM